MQLPNICLIVLFIKIQTDLSIFITYLQFYL